MPAAIIPVKELQEAEAVISVVTQTAMVRDVQAFLAEATAIPVTIMEAVVFLETAIRHPHHQTAAVAAVLSVIAEAVPVPQVQAAAQAAVLQQLAAGAINCWSIFQFSKL